MKVLVKRPTIGDAFETMNPVQKRAAEVAIGMASVISFVVGAVLIGAFWVFLG